MRCWSERFYSSQNGGAHSFNDSAWEAKALSAWSMENVPGHQSSTMRALWTLENSQCLLYIVLEPSALLFNLLLFVVVFLLHWKVCFDLLFTHCSNLNQLEEVRAWLLGRYSMSCSSDELFSSGSVSFVLFPRSLDLRDKWSWFFSAVITPRELLLVKMNP